MSTFVLPIEGVQFKGAFAAANGHTGELFTHSDILRAAFLVGRTARHATRFGAQSWLEAVWRLSTIQLGLDLTPTIPAGWSCYLRRHKNWSRLDSSERGVLNYTCGNVVAKLVAERVLRAPLILHHDVYRRYLRSPLGGRDERPDFVGWSPWAEAQPPNHSPWIALEAKGRTRFPTTKAIQKAKDQAGALSSVRGMPVAFAAACWSYESNGFLQAYLRDPEPAEDGLHLDIPTEDFAANYYAPISDALRLSELESRDEATVTYALPNLDLRIAVHRKLESTLRSNDGYERWLATMSRIQSERVLVRDTVLGPDGIALLPGESWLRRQRLTEGPDRGKG